MEKIAILKMGSFESKAEDGLLLAKGTPEVLMLTKYGLKNGTFLILTIQGSDGRSISGKIMDGSSIREKYARNKVVLLNNEGHIFLFTRFNTVLLLL